uniref:Toprim domain-containing protein n=1 Tax=Globodera pallida TaxID=36090 RepID=A0A183CRB7_GLOPA
MMKTIVSGTEWDNFFWLRDDEAADPTIAELARVMREAKDTSKPELLKAEPAKAFTEYTLEDAIKVSCARCAAVSYRNEGYDLEKSIELYERLVGSDKKHASALEHCATPMERRPGLPPPNAWEHGVSHMDNKCRLERTMRKKALEYRLQYALMLAKFDPNSKVLFAFSTWSKAQNAWHTLINLVGKPNGFSFNVLTRTAKHEDGGSIRFVSLEDPNCISGMQISHAWVEEDLEPYKRNAVEWHIRLLMTNKWGIDLSYPHNCQCPRCARNGRDTAKDNLQVYGEGKGAYCHACEFTILSDAEREARGIDFEDEEEEGYTGLKCKGWRGIKDETNKFFNIRYTYDEETGEPDAQYVPTTIDGKLVGFKVRTFPKDFSNPVGLVGKDCELAGQMLAEYQASRGYDPIPVVSPTVGETGCVKQIQAQYEWFNTFDKIIIGMDNDAAGEKAMHKIAKVLPKNKVYVAKWSKKDPNAMLVAGLEKQ